ncbi:MAG: hypothetical protein DI540_01030 [Sphingobium sp.]|nr:MAG: hypothetical protein DI540_01030 [Sphingobium sp.]
MTALAKSIFQLSPLDAETQRQSQGMGVIDLSPPALPDIDVPPPPAAPAASAASNRGDGRMPGAAKAPDALMPVFEAAALKYDVPINVLMALAEKESTYNPMAYGVQTQFGHAKGIMQYLDSTATRLGINPYDPVQSINAAAMQLGERLRKGYTMRDAIMEHFGGTNRAGWKAGTRRYGDQVTAIAQRLKGELASRYGSKPPSGGPWYAPGAEKGAGSGEVSADAVSALVGKPSRAKPTSLADTIENPNDLRNIIARRESEAQRKPDEGNLMPGQRPGVGDQFRSDVKRGVANVGNLGVGLAALGADLVGADDTADALLQRYIANEAENADKNPAVIGTYKNVHDLGDAGRYALEAVGENLPMLVPSLLSGGLGAVAARKAAERGVVKFIDAQIAKGVSREVAERQAAQFVTRRATAGAAGGAAASSVGMESGSIYGDTFSETGKKAPGLALTFGVPAGLLDAIEPVYALRRVAGPAVDQLAGGIIRRIGREAGTQFLIEAGTEGLQTLLEQAPKSIETGQPYWTEELLDQVIDAGLKGGIGGGVIGAGSGALSGRARPAPADPAIDAAAISAMSPSQAAGDVDAGAARTAPVPAEPPVSPAPQAAAPAPEPVAPPPPPPSGPLGRALARAPIAAPVSTLVPTPLAEDATPQRMVLEADGVNVPVQLLGETGDALWVRTESGEELQIPRADIEAGHVRLVDPEAVKPDLTAEAPAPAPAEELPEVVAPAPQPRTQDIQQEAPASSRETGEMFDAETGEVMIAPAKPARPAKVKPSPSTQNTLPAEVESDTAAASMSEADLRARLRYLASQARTNAGWTKPLLAEKKRVEAAIDAINEAREGAADAIKTAEAQAATSPLNDLPEPTEAQKEAGNYSKGHVAIGGLDVSIENPAGTSRRPEWPPLRYTYGYVKRSEGADGDHVDVFLGPKAADPTNPVFIVDQVNKDGSFDEHKVMVGFGDKGAARRGYLANYEKGWTGLGDITEMSFDDFRTWVKDPERTIAPAATKVAAAKVVEPQAPEAVVEEPSASETPPPTSAPAVTKPAVKRRPTDKKNPNPFVRDGERYTVSQDVDYLSAGATYEIESAGKRSAYFRNVERGGGTSLNNYVIERAMRDGVMSIAPEVVAVAEPDADRSVGKVSPAEQGATLDAPPAATAAPVPPAESAQTTDDVFSSNKLFTADKVEAARARLREKMNRINSGIDPEVLVDGMTIAGAYIEAGVRKFADYAAAMRADFGERITPYLLSFWEGARNYPGLDTAGMSTPEESRAAHAELLKPGLPVEEAVTLGTEVARPKREKPAAAGSRKLRDWGVDRIDGWMPVEGGENIDTGEGLKDGLKDAFLGDAAAYMRSVAAALRPLGFEPHPNAKGEASNPVARRTGGVAVSGDVTLHLRHPASGTNVFAIVGAGSLRGVVPTDGAGVSLMYRVSTKEGDKQATAGTNRWAPVDLSAIDLADTIAWEVERGQPEIVRGEVLSAEEADTSASDEGADTASTEAAEEEVAEPDSADAESAPEVESAETEPVDDDVDLFSEALEPIPAGDMFASPDALKATLDKSKFAPAIQRWIDAGRIVLHQSADTLPIGASRASIRAFLDGDPVVTLKGDEFAPDGYPLTSKVTRWYRENGGETVETPGIGEVSIDAVAVKNSVSHGLGRAKAAAFAAVPDVLRRGKIVHSEPLIGASDGGMAYFVAAPIRMGNQDMVEIVMIKSSRNAKRMYVHEVALREVLRQPTFKTSGQAAGADVHSGAGAGALRSILQNIYAAKPEDDASLASEAQSGVQGLTTPDGRIHLVADQLTEATALPVLLHEMFHAGVEPLLGEAKWKPLIQRLGRLYSNAAGLLVSGERDVSPFLLAALDRVDRARPPAAYTAEEFGAYAIEERAKLPAGIRDVVDRLLGVFKAWMLRRFGAQAGRVTPAQLQSLAIAALRSQPFAVTNEAGEVRYSRVVPSEREVAEATPDLISNAITKAMDGRASILGWIPLRPLLTELAGRIPAAREYLDLKQAMDALRDKWHAKADDVAQPWLRFRVLNREGNLKLMDLMHEATLAGVDPAKPFVSILTPQDREALAAGPDASGFEEASERAQIDRQRRADHENLKKAWDELPMKARQIYVNVRDAYREMSDAFEQVLLDNLSKALDIKFRQAKRSYDAEMIRIADSELSEEAKQAAFDEADKVYNRESRVQRYAKGARMTRLRAFFETNDLSGPYFPLARFGNFFVSARDKKSGEVASFSRFESPKEQQDFAREMRAIGHDVTVGVLEDAGALKKQVDARFITDIEAILEGADVTDSVRDAVWQRWLETMPDMSVRTNRIHRKGRAGFSRDALRAFGSHMFHGSHQLARLKYALDLDEAIALARDQAKTMPDPVRAGLIVNEMERRNQFVMNPTGGPIAQTITSAAFVYHLSVSPAAALVNVAQTAVMGVPILAAYEGSSGRGVSRASFELTKALKDFTAGKGHAAKAGALSEQERDAMLQAYETGLIERTQSHDLAGVGETGVEYSPIRTKVMGYISLAFHHTERMNREVTFLAAYRMARRKGEPHNMAIKTASNLTWKIHFDYQNTSRPRIMQSDFAKVVLTFKNFQVNMLWRLFRDVRQSLSKKGVTAAERREARMQLAGVTGMMMLTAGIRGTWMYGVAMLLASMFFGDDTEDDFAKAIIATLGRRAGGMALNGVPGDTLGVDLSRRIGMPDLWFQSPDRELEGGTEFDYWLLQFAGAGIGILRNTWIGTSMIADGKIYRGVETILPKFAKDLMRSARYMTEGARTLNGDPLIENMDASDVLKQALGFTPIELAELYDHNRSKKNKEKRILDQRSEILADFDLAIQQGKDTGPIVARIEKFNKENPDDPVSPRGVRQSMRTRRRMRERNQGGVYLNPKLAARLNEEATPLIYSGDDSE